MPRSLSDLPVLLLDCQTSGAAPDKGHLLEAGWALYRAGDDPMALEEIHAHLVRLPDRHAISGKVQALTGIDPKTAQAGLTPECLWQLIDKVAGQVAKHGGQPVFAVVHYARFEAAFINALYRDCAMAVSAPFTWLCTHAISRRALPQLPRHSLRAVAGYFGCSLGRHRRSHSHVRATAVIWHHLVALLARRHRIFSTADLQQWLGSKPPLLQRSPCLPLDRCQLDGLPDAPGVYTFKAADARALYIGKSAHLRARLRSYYAPRARHAPHIAEMLCQAATISYQTCDTALEAAIAETDAIKTQGPPYNQMLRGDERRPWYLSDDLIFYSRHADALHPVGPVLSKPQLDRIVSAAVCIEAIHAFKAGRSIDPPVGPWCPPPDVFSEGLAHISYKLPALLDRRPIASQIRRLGAVIRYRHRQRPAWRSTDPDAPDKKGEDMTWTDQQTAEWILETIDRAASRLRRISWLNLLANARIQWQRRDLRTWRCLTFAQSRLTSARTRSGPATFPANPVLRHGPSEPVPLDLPGHDRLRILSTELHRVLNAGRSVVIDQPGGLWLTSPAVACWLEWISPRPMGQSDA